MSIPLPELGQKLTCPLCSKEFTVSDDTKYIAKGGYVCTWKCFMRYIRSYQKMGESTVRKPTNPMTITPHVTQTHVETASTKQEPIKRKRGRPPKAIKTELW